VIGVELASQKSGDRLPSAIVIGGAQAAARDNHFRPLERVTEGGNHFFVGIAHHCFVDHANAKFV